MVNNGFQNFRRLVEGCLLENQALRTKTANKLNRRCLKVYLKDGITDLEVEYMKNFLKALSEVDGVKEMDVFGDFKKDIYYRLNNRQREA